MKSKAEEICEQLLKACQETICDELKLVGFGLGEDKVYWCQFSSKGLPVKATPFKLREGRYIVTVKADELAYTFANLVNTLLLQEEEKYVCGFSQYTMRSMYNPKTWRQDDIGSLIQMRLYGEIMYGFHAKKEG